LAKTLTAEMVILGTKFTKEIEIESYGGVTVEIRPVSATTMFKALNRMVAGAAASGVKPTDLEGLEDLSKEERLVKFMEMGISLEDVSDAMLILCREGIADEQLAKVINEDRFGAAMEIGTAIMDLSSGDDRAVLDFIEAATASSSPEPVPQDT